MQSPFGPADLLVVGKSWFPPGVIHKLTVAKVLSAMESLGLPKPKRLGLTKTLQQFGKQLIEEKLVAVEKTCNLSRSDVKKL